MTISSSSPLTEEAMAKTIAFGVEEDHRAYRLRLARYDALGETIGQFLRERVAERVRPLRLLDVGVGSGRSRRYIEKHVDGIEIRYTGLDISDKRLELVRECEAWTLVRANVEDGLPFAPACFDVVICEQVIEHLSHPGAVLQELARVLDKGGMLLVGVPIFPPGIAACRRQANVLLERWLGVTRSHAHTFTCRKFVNVVRTSTGLTNLEARGFRIISGGPLAPLESYRWWWRLNRLVGARLPSLCAEVQVVARNATPA